MFWIQPKAANRKTAFCFLVYWVRRRLYVQTKTVYIAALIIKRSPISPNTQAMLCIKLNARSYLLIGTVRFD